MDKILTKKILGLKVEDILKCVLLVGVGYCIAVMLGNCNCVEGLPFVCRAQTACSRDQCVNDDGTIDLDCEACPGWQLIDPDDGTTQPWITSPSQLYTCESRKGSNVGYGSREECIANTPYSLAEGPMGLSRKRGGVPECNAAPPYSPPTPTPLKCREYNCPEGMENKNQNKEQGTDPISNCCTAESKETCTYTGDSTGDVVELSEDWWKQADIKDKSCSTEIENCRADMRNWHNYFGGEYKGFCLQTVSDLKDGGTRGSCGRFKVGEEYIADPGIVGRGSVETKPKLKDPETACKDTAGSAGNFAWVAESDTRGIHSCNPHCPP